MLDPVLARFPFRRGFFASMESPPSDGDDLIQIAFQCCRRLLPAPLRFEKQLRLGEYPLAGNAFGVAPGVVEFGGLPCRIGAPIEKHQGPLREGLVRLAPLQCNSLRVGRR